MALLSKPMGLRYVSVNIEKPRGIFPSSYYAQTDWPLEVAEDVFALSKRSDGTWRIDQGKTEAFVLQGDTDIVLPCSIDGVAVTEIAACAFDILVPFRPPKETGIEFRAHSKSLTLPDTIEIIGSCAIAGLNPQTIYLPGSVYHIGNLGFYVNYFDSEDNIRQFVVAEDNEFFKSVDGSLYTHDLDMLICAARPYPEVFHVPETVTRFGLDTFAYGSALPFAVHIPDNLTEIRTVPNRECLWVCTEDSPAYRATQRNGYYVVTENYGHDGDYVYDILASGELMLVNYRGSDTDLVIPAEFAGRPLSIIGINAFPSGIKSITFPDTVKTITGNCFGIGLTRVKLPKYVETIGPGTFSEGNFDKPVIIPSTCTSIGKGSFYRSHCIFEGYDARVHMSSRTIIECFTEGAPPFDFKKYDESLLGLHDYPERLPSIISRIVYPHALDADTRRRFMLYLKGHQDEVMDYITKKDDLRVLVLLLDEEFFTPEDIENALKRFKKANYTQGVVQLIDYRHHHFERSADDRFSL